MPNLISNFVNLLASCDADLQTMQKHTEPKNNKLWKKKQNHLKPTKNQTIHRKMQKSTKKRRTQNKKLEHNTKQ